MTSKRTFVLLPLLYLHLPSLEFRRAENQAEYFGDLLLLRRERRGLIGAAQGARRGAARIIEAAYLVAFAGPLLHRIVGKQPITAVGHHCRRVVRSALLAFQLAFD